MSQTRETPAKLFFFSLWKKNECVTNSRTPRKNLFSFQFKKWTCHSPAKLPPLPRKNICLKKWICHKLAKPTRRCFLFILINECVTNPWSPRENFFFSFWKSNVSQTHGTRDIFLWKMNVSQSRETNECFTPVNPRDSPPFPPRKTFLWKNECVTDPWNPRERCLEKMNMS